MAHLIGSCQHRPMETYSIETDGVGGYRVKVTQSDGEAGYVAGGFPTWSKAQDWIDMRRRTQGNPASPEGGN
jgi:hypothetical protein